MIAKRSVRGSEASEDAINAMFSVVETVSKISKSAKLARVDARKDTLTMILTMMMIRAMDMDTGARDTKSQKEQQLLK